MEQYAISTHGLTKIFGRGFCALNNVCLNIRKGDIYGLVGRNGAGKTTLLRIVAGLSAADNGYVSINGATTYEENEIQRRRVGCIIEGPALYGGLTAWQNMEARALLVNADKDKINEALSLSGLEYFQGKKVKDFSLGMKQRLALALALLNEPEILLLDEPVNGLDPVGINDIRELLKKSTSKGDDHRSFLSLSRRAGKARKNLRYSGAGQAYQRAFRRAVYPSGSQLCAYRRGKQSYRRLKSRRDVQKSRRGSD